VSQGTRLRTLPPDRRRRSVRLQAPSTQLRLPLYVLLLTLGFGALLMLNGYVAYGRIYASTLMQAAPEMEELIHTQSRNFAVTSLCLGVAYTVAMIVVCVSYIQRVIGAFLPMRRTIVAMIGGDYSQRIRLRGSDEAVREIVDDVNELARTLELAATKPDRNRSASTRAGPD